MFLFLGQSPKQRTPPTHPYGFELKFHEKIISLEWPNMPTKHDIVFSLKSLDFWPPPNHSLGLSPKNNRLFFFIPSLCQEWSLCGLRFLLNGRKFLRWKSWASIWGEKVFIFWWSKSESLCWLTGTSVNICQIHKLMKTWVVRRVFKVIQSGLGSKIKLMWKMCLSFIFWRGSSQSSLQVTD